MSVDPNVLAELERLHQAATPGPWKEWPNPIRGDGAFVAVGEAKPYESRGLDGAVRMAPPPVLTNSQMLPADAALVAAMRNALPALLAVARDQAADKEWDILFHEIGHEIGAHDGEHIFDAVTRVVAERERLSALLAAAIEWTGPFSPAHYDALSEQFYRETRFMAPGKSVPLAMNPGEEWERERGPAWTRWLVDYRERLRADTAAVLKERAR